MASCLGLYIDEHLIKYAKVSKDRDNFKVESFGVKFYEKIEDAVSQVIEETYSQKTPISINMSEEMYNYFDMFALLTKNDLQKAIKTEFESFCADKGYNPNVFETRYAVVESQIDKDKIKVIHIADNKIELNKRIQEVEGYHLVNISPISMSIPNLVQVRKDENCIIVNIEDDTTITTIMGGKIFNVDIMEEGSKDFLSKINLKENSYAKSYEICKNTTIYTSEGRELQTGEVSSYLDDIMPTLYNVVNEVNKIINSNTDKFEKVYITGTGALINNIDLYFQEYLPDSECEILKPYFIENTRDISIKDYIEVNSAISIALMGLGEGVTGMNFKKKTLADQIPSWMKIEVNPDKTKKEQKNLGGFLTWDLGQKLDNTEKSLIRVAVGLFLLIAIYSGFSGVLNYQMNQKEEEANDSIAHTNAQISLAKADNEKIESGINDYTGKIQTLERTDDRVKDLQKNRNAIPNLLNQIMSVIPSSVQITSIETTKYEKKTITGETIENTKVVINAQSDKYEQLGYFVAVLKNDVILTGTGQENEVKSTTGQKSNGVVTIQIEGDLPI